MASITPGYDFGVSEIPTRDKFRAAALGLSLGDLSQDVLDANFLTLLIGDTSGASGGLLTDQGQLWISPDGTIWGKTIHGDVRVRRVEGGWETKRIWWNGSSGAEGVGWNIGPGVDTSATLSGDPSADRYDTGNGNDILLTAESTASGLMRLIGRGVCRYALTGSLGISESSFKRHTNMFRVQGVGGAYWNSEEFFLGANRAFVGPALGLPLPPEGTKVSQAPLGAPFRIEGSCWGYWYGHRIYGDGSTP